MRAIDCPWDRFRARLIKKIVTAGLEMSWNVLKMSRKKVDEMSGKISKCLETVPQFDHTYVHGMLEWILTLEKEIYSQNSSNLKNTFKNCVALIWNLKVMCFSHRPMFMISNYGKDHVVHFGGYFFPAHLPCNRDGWKRFDGKWVLLIEQKSKMKGFVLFFNHLVAPPQWN